MSESEHGNPDTSGNQDVRVLALVKGEERYVFAFVDRHRADVLRTLGRFASNPDLSFTWYDAAVLSKKIRQEPASASHPISDTAEDRHRQEQRSLAQRHQNERNDLMRRGQGGMEALVRRQRLQYENMMRRQRDDLEHREEDPEAGIIRILKNRGEFPPDTRKAA